MRFSKALISTSKEVPNDAVTISHILLIRAGLIQGVASGLYNYLPLGKKVLDNITKIIKEELDKAGCQEVDLSFVTPAELWAESGRIEKFGKELLRFKDRKENLFVLGPTHEEMMVNLVRNSLKSYKSLPQNLYQIKTKFRDEARPRFGLMRGREFVMKDGYSFHSSKEDMAREFDLMEETYKKICEVFKSNDYVAQMNYIISSMEELSGAGKIKIITDEYEEIKTFENLEECIDKNIRFIISGMPITQKMVDMFYEKTATPVMIGKEVRITKKPLGLKIFTYRALKDGNLTNALRPY